MLRSLRVLNTPLSLAITLSAAGVLMITMGARQSLGLFVSPIHDSTGLGVAAISLALAVGQFAWGAIQPLAGALADRHGPHGVLWVGVLTLALGARLFERSTRRLRPTPAGEAFYPHALAAVAAVDCAQRALSHLGSAPRGLLRISATMTFGREYIAPLLPALTERHPELECELILTDQMVDLVDDRIDLALRQTQTPPADAVAKPLLQMERVICAAPEYLARHGTPEHPLQLAHQQGFSYLLTDDGHWRLRDARGEEWSAPVRGRVQFTNLDCL